MGQLSAVFLTGFYVKIGTIYTNVSKAVCPAFCPAPGQVRDKFRDNKNGGFLRFSKAGQNGGTSLGAKVRGLGQVGQHPLGVVPFVPPACCVDLVNFERAGL